MRNSYAVDCSISSLGTVSGKDYTGGFAGIATLGDVADIDEMPGTSGNCKGSSYRVVKW